MKEPVITSEEQILTCIDHHFPKTNDTLQVKRGDDCAVLTIKNPLCISTDMFIEDVHFRQAYFTPQDIGWKALARNISDLAACAAIPLGFSVGLAVPASTPLPFIDGLYEGMAELAKKIPIMLLGGDLSKAQNIYLCITVLGETIIPLQRAQGHIGDSIFLIGHVGLSRIALQMLEQGIPSVQEHYPCAYKSHTRPYPLVKEAQTLLEIANSWETQTNTPHRLSLIDVSDGLAQDLPRLIGPCLGASITIPNIHKELIQFTQEGHSPYTAPEQHAFLGGEDYALLGTCDPNLIPTLQKNIPTFSILGHVTKEPHILCNGITAQGFDHFSQ